MNSNKYCGKFLHFSVVKCRMTFEQHAMIFVEEKWNTRQEDAQAKYSVIHEGNPIHQPG